MTNGSRMVVFTDLDGTLLDHATYSFEPALEALERLQHEGTPVVLCSSKTRAELDVIQQSLRIQDPFISENGGAVFVPRGYFPFMVPGSQLIAGYETVELGTPYSQLALTLHRIAAQENVAVVGFSDLSVEEVSRDCKMPLLQARLAKLRDYDEPFRFLDADPAAQNRFLRALHRAGLRCVVGGRYHHLTGVTDKGHAIRLLKSLYERAWGGVRTVGLGDSLNDLPLLQEVDVPIVIPNSAAGATARLLRKVPIARSASEPGPHGWNKAILQVLADQACWRNEQKLEARQ